MEALVALLHDCLRQLTIHLGRRRAGPDGVLECECARESRFLDDAKRVFEVCVGLTREPDDDVGRDRGVRNALAHGVEDAEELLRPVRTAHRLQHGVGTGLQRHVQHGHDVRRLCHCSDDVFGERRRVRAREAHSLEPLHSSHGAQQFAERLTVAELDAVCVDVLPEERDFDRAVVDERLHFGEDVARATVLLLAAEGRHDAEGAGVVAADRNGDPAAGSGIAFRGQGRREDFERFEDLDLSFSVVSGPFEEGRERPHVVRAEYDVDPGRLLDDGALVLLREAAADGDLHSVSLSFHTGEVSEVAVELVRGVLAHGARVDDDDVSRLRRLRCDVAGGFQ